MTEKLPGSLRLLVAAIIVLSIVIPGYLNRSAWIIVLATPVFTVLYALGKWDAWKHAWRVGGARVVIVSLLTTMPIQLVLVAFLYLIGLGASMLFGAAGGIKPLTWSDVTGVVVLLVVATAIASFINVLEAKAGGQPVVPVASPVVQPAAKDDAGFADETLEIDIDPRPLTPETFYVSRGYWKPDVLFNALGGRGETVVKQPEAADEEAIEAAEARLGVRLPEALRAFYKVMDGGYVGWLYVPLKADPGPFYSDWRGAFSIDYSSLYSLRKLRTVKEHYEDFTDDPDEMPPNADRLIVLQARYQDMTVLDYSQAGEPKVRLVDFEEYADRSTDVEFADFDSFFAALRRPREEQRRLSGDQLLEYRTRPIGEMTAAQQPSEFWSSNPHVFYNQAASRQDGSEPKKTADDVLVAETEARLGVSLPSALVDLWRYRNGGGLAARYLQTNASDAAYAEIELPEQLAPMEYFATIADLSDRVKFPDGEIPLRDRHPGADKLVVLEVKNKAAVMLDYRGTTDEPGVLFVRDLENDDLTSAERRNSFTLMLDDLRAWKRSD